jgi:hypothetical protein
MAGLSPEQQAQFVSELEKRRASLGVESAGVEPEVDESLAASAEPEPAEDAIPPQNFSTFFSRIASNLNPIPLVQAVGKGFTNPSGLFGDLFVRPAKEQFAAAQEAELGGRELEANARRAAGAVPVLGPMVASTVEDVSRGNIAEPLADALSMFMPVGGALGKVNRAVSGVAKSRGIKRALTYLDPDKADILQVERHLRETPESIGHLGYGTSETLAGRAAGFKKAAQARQEAQRGLDDPGSVQPVADKLKQEATRYETSTVVQEPYKTGLIGPDGKEIMGFRDKEVITSQFPAHGAEHRARAATVEELEGMFGGEVPAGEAIKQRGAAGRAGAAAEGVLPGTKPAAGASAAKSTRQEFSKYLHDPDGPYAGLGIAETDKLFDRWKSIADAAETAHATAKKAGIKDSMSGLLLGRLGAKLGAGMLGAGAVALAGGSVGAGAIGGALLGYTLSKSAFWNSLRATEYIRLHKFLKAGKTLEAQELLTKAVQDYNVVKERQRKPLGKIPVGGELATALEDTEDEP